MYGNKNMKGKKKNHAKGNVIPVILDGEILFLFLKGNYSNLKLHLHKAGTLTREKFK